MSNNNSGIKKILIIDDEDDLLRITKTRLKASGYEVLTLDSGEHAVEVAKREKPDLILLDIMMPEKDGCAVRRELKADRETREIPIIFLTCLYTKEDEKSKGHAIEGNFFIAKPIDQNELLTVIKDHIDGK
jgi:DNA-binding response OmpR family regulator